MGVEWGMDPGKEPGLGPEKEPGTDPAQGLATPCYVIDLDRLDRNAADMRDAFRAEWGPRFRMGYSIKTNHLPYLLRHAKEQGFLAEAVSSDEYRLALAQGFRPDEVIYNGPRKDPDSLLFALNHGSIVNIDNLQEIDLLAARARELDRRSCRVGIRVNFDLESVCRGETSAGGEASRFGVCVENGDFAEALGRLEGLGIPVQGLHMHFSTRTRSLAVYRALARKAAELVERHRMHGSLKFVNIGGGFWGGRRMPGRPTMEEYSRVICGELRGAVDPEQVELIAEPGASILATAAEYRTRVANVRDVRGTRIVTVDGTYLHINPFLVEREHPYEVWPGAGFRGAGRPGTGSPEAGSPDPAAPDPLRASRQTVPLQIVCGSTCMENDRLLRLRDEPELRPGDILVFPCVGAYTMAYNSCFILVPPDVYARRGDDIVRVRERKAEWMECV